MCEVTNILVAYHSATRSQVRRGNAWYSNVKHYCTTIANTYGVSTAQVAGVVSAFSPMFAWDTYNKATDTKKMPNLVQAVKALDMYFKIGRVQGLHFKRQEDKAWRILEGERPTGVLTGPKVRSFYRCIMGYGDAVVVDRWAWRVARPDVPYRSGYQAVTLAPIQEAYCIAGDLAHKPAHMMQAITWLAIREQSNG